LRLNVGAVADQATLRDQAGTTRFFAGLDLVEPGVVAVASGVARKP
jgi:hypothetical protein